MFASLGAYGHLYPMMPLALACADAGHEAVIASGPPFLGRLPLPTVPGYPPDLELDWAIKEARRRHPDLHDQDFSMTMFADVIAESVAPTMIEQCERVRPDLVIYEAMNTGAGVAASVLGIPAVGVRDCSGELLLRLAACCDGWLPTRHVAAAWPYAARGEWPARSGAGQPGAADTPPAGRR